MESSSDKKTENTGRKDIAGSTSTGKIHNPASTVASPVDGKKGLTDLSYLIGITNNDKKLMMQMINMYVEQAPSLITMMKKGLEDKNWDLLQKAAHKLIPSFSTVGIDRSYEMMAKKIQVYAGEEKQLEGTRLLVLELETVCKKACAELMEANINLQHSGEAIENHVKLFLVDDDAFFLKRLEIEFLRHGDFDIKTYSTGELCLEHLANEPDIIILDYHLDSIEEKAMNGVETLDKIKAFKPDIPVIMLSSQDKIEVAIECMHHGAGDYVVKSETSFFRLQKIINTVFSYKKMEKKVGWYMDRM